jgi:hypothetical protein
VRSAASDELVFVPQTGFRLARGGLRSENVVVRQGSQTLTAHLSSDRDGADLSMNISGVDEKLDFRKSRPVEAPVTVIDDRGIPVPERLSRFVMNSCFYRLMEGPTQFQRMVTLDRLDPGVRSVEVAMSGGAGEWRVVIPLTPVTAAGAQGVPTTAKAMAHDIEISVPLVARTPTLTAIELETYDRRRPETVPIDQAERWIEGIGCFQHVRGLEQDLLILRDSTGTHHLERPHAVQDQARRGRRREVALFEAVADGATSASVEIPYIAVRERSDELKVPVPGETEIALSGCRALVTTSRVERSSDCTPDHPSPIAGLNGPCVRMVIVPVESGDAERQLVMVGIMESNDRGMTVSRSRADPPVIDVPDPTGDASFITLKNPLIRMQGPWVLEFGLPTPDA